MNQLAHANPALSIPEQLRLNDTHTHPQNVGTSERIASAAVGGGLAVYGLFSRSLAGCAVSLAGAALVYRGWTGHCACYSRLGMNTAAARHSDVGVRAQHGQKITRSIHVNRGRRELYDHWRKLENLPAILCHLKSVESIDDRRSRWTAQAPGGRELHWEAEIITDRPGEILAWQSLPDSEVDTAGSVRFEKPASGEGTDLEISLKYDPPGGRVAAEVAQLLGCGLDDLLQRDLQAFQQTMESETAATPTGAEPGPQETM